MGLTTTLNTAQGGMQLSQTAIDVIGNNLANSDTNGFKAAQILFSTQLSQTLSIGAPPTATSGGTNPMQIGLGAKTAALTTDFGQGALLATGGTSDLAIQGPGFFVVEGSNGQAYTRAGNFLLNEQSQLVNTQGARVLGYDIDAAGNVDTGTLVPLEIPFGTVSSGNPTTTVSITGTLLGTGDVATQGTILNSAPLVDGAAALITAASAGTTLLSDLRLQSDPATPLFAVNDEITFAPTKGTQTLSGTSLTVQAGTTVQEYLDFINESLGIQETDAGGAPLAGSPGVTMDAGGSGQIVVTGNYGTVNDVTIGGGAIQNNGTPVDLSFTKLQTADGEGTSTSFIVYDSLGTPITVRMHAYLESTSANSATFRYLVESSDDSDLDIAVGNGTLTFDSVGGITANNDNTFVIDRAATAASPLQFDIDLSTIFGGVSDSGSELQFASQDGTPPGTLTDFVIDEQGLIRGVFDNGLITPVGQIVLSTFANSSGLIHTGDNLFVVGVNSGVPRISIPGSLGSGTIQTGAIEKSNVEIGEELIELINVSAVYRGNARVISTAQQMIDELLILGR